MGPLFRRGLLALTLVLMLAISLPRVPRAWVDFAGLPLLDGSSQPDTYGTDTISDMYGARVVLHDPLDMYTKHDVEQTPLEAATWSKEATACTCRTDPTWPCSSSCWPRCGWRAPGGRRATC